MPVRHFLENSGPIASMLRSAQRIVSISITAICYRDQSCDVSVFSFCSKRHVIFYSGRCQSIEKGYFLTGCHFFVGFLLMLFCGISFLRIFFVSYLTLGLFLPSLFEYFFFFRFFFIFLQSLFNCSFYLLSKKDFFPIFFPTVLFYVWR